MLSNKSRNTQRGKQEVLDDCCLITGRIPILLH